MKDPHFNNLIDRYLAGEVSALEREKINAWMNVRKVERVIDLDLGREGEDRVLGRIVDGIGGRTVSGRCEQSITPLLPSTKVIRLAASIVFVLSVSLTLKKVLRDDVVKPEKGKPILNDGTLVWYQRGSTRASLARVDSGQEADLMGADLPEILKSVCRMTGLVDYAMSTSCEVFALPKRREYMMSFDNVTIESVIEKVERIFEMKELHFLQCIDLTDNSLENALAMLARVLNLSSESIENKLN